MLILVDLDLSYKTLEMTLLSMGKLNCLITISNNYLSKGNSLLKSQIPYWYIFHFLKTILYIKYLLYWIIVIIGFSVEEGKSLQISL